MAATTDQEFWESISRRYDARELTKRERAAYNLANENADQTSVEEKFELFSDRWYHSFVGTYEFNLDCMSDGSVEAWGF